MAVYLVRRGALALLVLLTVSLLSFGLLKVSGDLAIALAGEQAGTAYVTFLRKQYGLDDPVIVQYLRWLARLFRGDLGTSFYFGTPVTALLAEKLPITMTLGVSALSFAALLSIPLGAIAA